MSRVVVLGAGGFIGNHLVRALAENKHDTIVAFDRFPSLKATGEHPFLALANVEAIAGDYFNRAELSAVLTQADYVFHLISSTTPAASNKDPLIDVDTNIRTSVDLFGLCVEKGVKKVIFPSSGGTVYGEVNNGLISELTLPQPQSPYGIGKLTIEHYLRYFKHSFGLDYIVYRIANPYGPGQNIYGKQGVIPIFMHKFLTKEPLTVYGDGSMVRDYIYIDDLIKMMVSTFRKNSKFSEYNVGTGTGESVNEIIANIEACAGYSAEKQHIPTPPTFVHKSVLDITRFTEEFGPITFTQLDEGIKRTWEYVKEL